MMTIEEMVFDVDVTLNGAWCHIFSYINFDQNSGCIENRYLLSDGQLYNGYDIEKEKDTN